MLYNIKAVHNETGHSCLMLDCPLPIVDVVIIRFRLERKYPRWTFGYVPSLKRTK